MLGSPNHLEGSTLSLILWTQLSFFPDASWLDGTNEASLGFVLSYSQNCFLLVGATSIKCDSPLHAEIAALIFALEKCLKRNWKPIQIFTDCINISNLIKNLQAPATWCLTNEAFHLQHLINSLHCLRIDVINNDDNHTADHLALHSRSNPNPDLTLLY